MCDLDGNGMMSRSEFNFFNLRTSGEEVQDTEWDVVEGKKSFIILQLYMLVLCLNVDIMKLYLYITVLTSELNSYCL